MNLPHLIKRLSFVRKYLPFLATMLLVAVVYPGFLRPMLQSVQASVRGQAFCSLYEKRLAALEQIGAHLEKECLRLRNWRAAQTAKIFSPSEADTFFASLEERAARTRCRLTSVEYESKSAVSPLQTDKSGTVQIQQVRLQMLGTYDSWIQWVEHVESLPECVLLDSLKLDVQKDRSGLLTGRLCLRVPVSSAVRMKMKP